MAFNTLNNDQIRKGDPALGLAEHRDIFEAVRNRDAALARARLIAHFSHVQERISQTVEAEEPVLK